MMKQTRAVINSPQCYKYNNLIIIEQLFAIFLHSVDISANAPSRQSNQMVDRRPHFTVWKIQLKPDDTHEITGELYHGPEFVRFLGNCFNACKPASSDTCRNNFYEMQLHISRKCLKKQQLKIDSSAALNVISFPCDLQFGRNVWGQPSNFTRDQVWSIND